MKAIFVVCLCYIFVFSLNNPVKILCGRTGTGKSYISNLYGCKSEICPLDKESFSCTDVVIYCPDLGLIDSVGLDDDRSKVIQYQGKNITLSGSIWPIYYLLEALEQNKITFVEFFFVQDINNIREGYSSIFFKNIIENELKCSITTVMNKFRKDSQKHLSIAKEGDLLVEENAEKVDLQGKPCTLLLSKDWRNRLISNDLNAIRSQLNITQCEIYRNQKQEYQSVLDQSPLEQPPQVQFIEIPPQSDCKQRVRVGRECKRKILGTCVDYHGVYEDRIDQNCINNQNQERERIENQNLQMIQEREQEVQRIEEINNELQKRQDEYRKAIIEVSKGLIECQQLIANFET